MRVGLQWSRCGAPSRKVGLAGRAALCVIGMTVTVPAVAQPTYRLVEIASGQANDIDPTGTYVTGFAADPAALPGRQRAFVWNGGAPVFLPGSADFKCLIPLPSTAPATSAWRR